VSAEEHHAEWGDQPTIPFSKHVLSEITSVILLLALYSLLAIFIGAHLDIKADPAMTPEGSKPEWYFLFLFAFLHYVPPLVGTLAPVVGLAFLALLPWIDRNPERAPSKRKFAITACILLLGGIVWLSFLGLYGGH
jgi:ubiquinol-cytochrome c reductase cytochrome b subunit